MGEQMIATIASREADAQMIEQALQNFKGEIVQLPSFTEVKPKKRTSWIDPESKLERKAIRQQKQRTVSPKMRAGLERARSARALREAKRNAVPDHEATQTELARRYGVSRSAVQQLIKKHTSIDLVIAHLRKSAP